MMDFVLLKGTTISFFLLFASKDLLTGWTGLKDHNICLRPPFILTHTNRATGMSQQVDGTMPLSYRSFSLFPPKCTLLSDIH